MVFVSSLRDGNRAKPSRQSLAQAGNVLSQRRSGPLINTLIVSPMSKQMNPTAVQLMAKVSSYLGGIYEHSPWVAQALCSGDLRLYTTVSEVAAAMKAVVDASPRERKLELLCAHPDLCEKVSKLESLTKESQDEQSRSGFQSLMEEELVSFNQMNEAYRKKCGFPFIISAQEVTWRCGRLNISSSVTGAASSIFCHFSVALYPG